MQVKINNKTYTIGELGFKDMVHMEDMGFSIFDIFEKQKVFSMATAFVGVVVQCDREEAERLIEQHVMGGGDISVIYQTFTEAIDISGFFKKLLKIDEQEKPKK